MSLLSISEIHSVTDTCDDPSCSARRCVTAVFQRSELGLCPQHFQAAEDAITESAIFLHATFDTRPLV
jgi:hypothetical protein